MKTVLVTGGNGFIGRHVVSRLEVGGYKVWVLDNRDRVTGSYRNIILGDVRDAVAVTEAVAHADGVIHLAGVLGTQETLTNPRPAAETNVIGGLNVLEACAQYKLPLVNIAVGNFWMNNTYSISKDTVSRFGDMFRRFRGTRVTNVRAFNAYGPGQDMVAPWGSSKVRKVLPNFINRALDGDPIEVYGDGKQVMDMIYVEDLAHILVAALEETAAGGVFSEAVEAGTGRETTVNEIASLVAQEVAHQTGNPPVGIVHLPMRPGEDESAVVVGDPDTLKGLIEHDLEPLENGLQKTVAYYKSLR